MNGNAAIDFRNPILIRRAGMSALKKELGTVGTAYFMRQFNTGQGDYTTEREEMLEGITLGEIINGVRKLDKQQP